ncbi:MAG: hypothetical protein ABFS45_17125 [Pseudomonadota bacterium]
MAQFSKSVYVEAVNQKCAECVYDPGSPGTWREQVKGCCGFDCSLYPIRPLPNGEKHAENPVIPNQVERQRQFWRDIKGRES